MRSTFSGLNTMVRGIFTHQLELDTTGHNITNANSEGYSRQQVRRGTTLDYHQPTTFGGVNVGTGVEPAAVNRARNLYADKQYWSLNSQHEYYKVLQTNYDKVESVFNDSTDTGIQSYMERFFKSWQDLSTSASTSANRVTVLEQAKNLVDSIQSAAQNLQQEIEFQYEEMLTGLNEVNNITSRIVELNQQIMVQESTGGKANDLRDSRDLEVDKLSKYLPVTVYEDSETGMYSVVADGLTIVSDLDRCTLGTHDTNGVNNAGVYYGVADHYIKVDVAETIFEPSTGAFRAYREAINTNKQYINDLANISAFLLSTFNQQHQQGVGIDDDATTGQNFFGNSNTTYEYEWSDLLRTTTIKATYYDGIVYDETTDSEVYKPGLVSRTSIEAIDEGDPSKGNYVKVTSSGRGDIVQREDLDGTMKDTLTLSGMQIIGALSVSSLLSSENGYKYVAARQWGLDTAGTSAVVNGTDDGQNAIWISALFNTVQEETGYAVRNGYGTDFSYSRSIGSVSLNSYYARVMSDLGSDSESVDINEDACDNVLEQVVNWRSETAGVDWNEELTNMLKFQKGYVACARCLTTMDEMLDRLINSTGVVGR
ncbi:MAG: flagellar hook-associated protein FlgK [Selenomonadaceae bacterium]|nr:flagellar hook-associated protein FlgK [Selenomonadaceae bacterium]